MVVEEQDVQKKIEAVKCYTSQANRSYTKDQFIKGLLVTHGVQIGAEYAEVFEIPRIIMGKDIEL